MEDKSYHHLIVWQKADDLARFVFKITASFPGKYFSLISQMQRAVLSVPANIVEGYSRRTKKEKLRFCEIALSSLTELEYYIEFCLSIELYKRDIFDHLSSKQIETAKLISGLMKSLKS